MNLRERFQWIWDRHGDTFYHSPDGLWIVSTVGGDPNRFQLSGPHAATPIPLGPTDLYSALDEASDVIGELRRQEQER